MTPHISKHNPLFFSPKRRNLIFMVKLKVGRASKSHCSSLLPPLICCFLVTVICPSARSGGHPGNGSVIFYASDSGLQQFEKWWNKSKTVPFYLIGLLLPLLNFKSPSFFSKFNILGKPRHCVIEPLYGRIHAGFCGNMV